MLTEENRNKKGLTPATTSPVALSVLWKVWLRSLIIVVVGLMCLQFVSITDNFVAGVVRLAVALSGGSVGITTVLLLFTGFTGIGIGRTVDILDDGTPLVYSADGVKRLEKGGNQQPVTKDHLSNERLDGRSGIPVPQVTDELDYSLAFNPDQNGGNNGH